MSTSATPIPISARLALSDAAVERLQSARGRTDKKGALQEAVDDLTATLIPRLEELRAAGRIVDFATSWMLAEAVVHVLPEHADDVRATLASFPELRDVTGDGRVARQRLRKLF